MTWRSNTSSSGVILKYAAKGNLSEMRRADAWFEHSTAFAQHSCARATHTGDDNNQGGRQT
jgi:hypothetical protein